jgi:hypothetical protein
MAPQITATKGPHFILLAILDLPSGFTNATFKINSYAADDSSAVYLNGTELKLSYWFY